jgi:acyl CoA:acetate/3-ketoacid CoA transferase alpha subunit
MWMLLSRSPSKSFLYDRYASTAASVRFLQNSNKKTKLVSSASEALSDCIFPGAVVACGGFGLGGVPETLLNEVSRIDNAKDLTLVHLTAGVDGYGLGKLIESNKVKRICSSYVGENKACICHSMMNNALVSTMVNSYFHFVINSTLKTCTSAEK